MKPFLLFCIASMVLLAGGVNGQVVITEPCVITEPGEYVLGNDITCSGYGIIVKADNVTLDGQNHTIRGDGGINESGIYLGGVSNVTIRNFRIKNFDIGINVRGDLSESDGHNIYSNFLDGDSIYSSQAIYFYSSTNGNIYSNTITHVWTGIFVMGSDSNNIYSNTMGHGGGISVVTSNNNNIHHNVLNDKGIRLETSDNNIISFNVINDASDGIFLLDGSDNNKISDNSGLNDNYGIYLNHWPKDNTGNYGCNTITGNKGDCYNCTGKNNHINEWANADGSELCECNCRVDEVCLEQNSPNPFNTSTTITFVLPKTTYITLEIYNLLGQKVRTLVEGIKEPGSHTVAWDSRDEFGKEVAGGIYLYRITGRNFTKTKKMLLLK